MSDPMFAARSALGPSVRPGRYGDLAGEAGVTLGERIGLGMASIIARKGKSEAASAAAHSAFGAALPMTPLYKQGRDIAFLWTGPERWLAMSPGRSSEELARALAESFSGTASIAAQGDGRAVISIAGCEARDVLAKILAIDLHPRAFRPGDTAITAAAHNEVQIWQLDETPSYELSLFRGFAGSFWHALTQAAAEYGYRVIDPD